MREVGISLECQIMQIHLLSDVASRTLDNREAQQVRLQVVTLFFFYSRNQQNSKQNKTQ